MDPPEDLHSSSSLTRPRLTRVPVRGSLLVYRFLPFLGLKFMKFLLLGDGWALTWMPRTDRWMPWMRRMYVYNVVALDGRMCCEGCRGWMLKIMVNL